MTQTKIIGSSDIIRGELPDGRLIEGRKGIMLEALFEPIRDELPAELMAGIVNGEFHELTHRIEHDCRIQPVTREDSDGWIIYRRTLTFLLCGCFEELFPEARLIVKYPITSGGIFCSVDAPFSFTQEKLESLKELMLEKISANKPFLKKQISLKEAEELFTAKNKIDKLELIKNRAKDYLTIYELDQYRDYFYGFMLPSTGYLTIFDLEMSEEENAFLLRFPNSRKSKEIKPVIASEKMLSVFEEYDQWQERLHIYTLASINRAIEEKRIEETVLVAESLQNRRFVQVAERIAAHQDKIRVVLIAGPSSSGKTTSSKRLSIELLTHGISPVPIEMDDFFVDRVKTPKDENGEYDFESIYGLNLELLSDCVKRLIAGETVQLPHYNFITGKSEPGKTIKLEKGQILILEGIHGLDPLLFKDIPSEQKFRIFVAPITQVNIDFYNRISTNDVRLMRRIVRDFQYRGYSAQQTIALWDKVRAGEEKWIYPYLDLADELINTSLVYEIAAIKPLAETALRMVPHNSPEHNQAIRLLNTLSWIRPMDADLIPGNSLLREFVGASNLKNFTVWNG